MTDYFRYILFRTEAWTFTGALLMIGIYASQVLDVARPRDDTGAVVGGLFIGAIGTGLIGGACAALWQIMRLVRGRRVPPAPGLFNALTVARPGMLKGAIIGFLLCFTIAVLMSGLFALTKERTGIILGSRIVWQICVGFVGAALGAAIASIGGLLIKAGA